MPAWSDLSPTDQVQWIAIGVLWVVDFFVLIWIDMRRTERRREQSDA